jgi:hypothetical protein
MDYKDFRYLIAWIYISGPVDKELQESRQFRVKAKCHLFKYKDRRSYYKCTPVTGAYEVLHKSKSVKQNAAILF